MIDKKSPSSPLPVAPSGDTFEKYFEIAVPALVRGIDSKGIPFEETTEIARISSEEAVFRLQRKVLINTPLNLTLRVPRTLILGNDLDLKLSGTVHRAASEPVQRDVQVIALRLHRSYSIQAQQP